MVVVNFNKHTSISSNDSLSFLKKKKFYYAMITYTTENTNILFYCKT